MKTYFRRLAGLGLILLFVLACKSGKLPENRTDYVNAFIGSKGHGHVFVGANVPFGAVQLGPSQIMQSWDEYSGWDWTSGYNYKSKEILGFTHTHLSGTGIGDLNDILVLPANGDVQIKPMTFNKPQSGYGSYFKKENETVKPGYYSVFLDKYAVKAELTTTERVGFHQYTYSDSKDAHLLVDLGFGMGWDSPVKCHLTQIDEYTFTGYRYSKGWAKNQRIYFALKTSVPVTKTEIFNVDGEILSNYDATDVRLIAALHFTPDTNNKILTKVAVSPVSMQNALLNMEQELSHRDFEQTKNDADKKWNEVLNKIEIDAADSLKTIYYTALYHTHFAPSLFNDINGDYRGSDGETYNDKSFQNYTIFSLWDTYRALHPLLNIISLDKSEDFVKTLLKITQQQDALAMWPLHGNETFTMVGNPGMIVIADAYLKGLISEETAREAFETLEKVINYPTEKKLPLGQKWVKDLKWIPADEMVETVAWGLEYAIADAVFAKMAEKMGQKEKAEYYEKRSRLFKAYFDEKVGFFNGRFENGKFREDFDPFAAEHRQNDFIEGNAWQYLWLVPQHPYELIELLGGKETFINRLDEFFTLPSELSEGASNDITGLIGQYAHGNEPSHHVTYLYAFAGQQWKTAERVRQIMNEFYTAQADGLIGNEDVGQMSAWFNLSALGLYPANPVTGQFVFGSPVVNSAKINLPGGKYFTIKVENNSSENIYIQSVKLNGKDYQKTYIHHNDIVSGGELVFVMGNTPNKEFGSARENRPD